LHFAALFKGTIMSSFINIQYPAEHPGVARFESAVGAARQLRTGFDSTRGLAGLLLAAIVAAMVVVADQLVENWAEGHLLVAWVAMWAVAFSVIALFAGTARHLATRVLTALDAWSGAIAQARADVRLWEAAKADPRVMADLQVAMSRAESSMEALAVPSATADVVAAPVGLSRRALRLGGAELRAYQRNFI
jgi:hypothetical protein